MQREIIKWDTSKVQAHAKKKNKEENNVMKLRVEVSSSPQSCEIDHSNFDEESRITKDQHVSEIHL